MSSSLTADSTVRSSSAKSSLHHRDPHEGLQSTYTPNRFRRSQVTTSAILCPKELSNTSNMISLESSLVLPEDPPTKTQPDYLQDVSTLLYLTKLYTKSGETALMLAAKSYRGKMDKNLLALEAGMRDSYGRLASCIAIERGNTEFH